MSKRFIQRISTFYLGAVLLVPSLGGCGRGSNTQTSAAKPSPSPSASARPAGLPVEAQIDDLDLTLLDEKGLTIVQLTARAGTIGPGKAGTQMGGAVGTFSGGTAVLYQQGKPAAKLTADSVRAEQESRTVVAKGNATVTSLAEPNTPAIRADTMTWRYETGTIKGVGNVLVTRKPDLRIPGTSFSADTRLRSFSLKGGGGAGAGTF